MYHPSFTLNDTPLAVMADKDPPSPTLLGLTPVVASRHREEEQACHEQSAVEAIHL